MAVGGIGIEDVPPEGGRVTIDFTILAIQNTQIAGEVRINFSWLDGGDLLRPFNMGVNGKQQVVIPLVSGRSENDDGPEQAGP